jgi:hypothetical protein
MATRRKGRRKGVSLIKSKATVIDGIKFKSKLEAHAYKELKKALNLYHNLGSSDIRSLHLCKML